MLKRKILYALAPVFGVMLLSIVAISAILTIFEEKQELERLDELGMISDFLPLISDEVNKKNALLDEDGEKIDVFLVMGAFVVYYRDYEEIPESSVGVIVVNFTDFPPEGGRIANNSLNFLPEEDRETALQHAEEFKRIFGTGYTSPLKDVKNITDYIVLPFGEQELEDGTFKMHGGADIAFDGIDGRPIFPIAEGVVISSELDEEGYGEYIIIEHSNGVQSRYAQLGERNVEVGDTVFIDDEIGTVGSTGSAESPHLHLEVMFNGSVFDPYLFLSGITEDLEEE